MLLFVYKICLLTTFRSEVSSTRERERHILEILKLYLPTKRLGILYWLRGISRIWVTRVIGIGQIIFIFQWLCHLNPWTSCEPLIGGFSHNRFIFLLNHVFIFYNKNLKPFWSYKNSMKTLDGFSLQAGQFSR